MAIVALTTQFEAVGYARAGLFAIQAGHYDKSRAFLAKAVQLNPDLGEAWRWLGALHQGAQRAICLQWAKRTLPHARIPDLPPPQLPAIPVETRSRVTEAATPHQRKRLPAMLYAAGGVSLAALLALGSFELAYADKIYPGITVFGQSLNGLEIVEATQLIAPKVQGWSQRWLVVQADERQWRVAFTSLSSFDASAVAAQAFELGRAGSWTSRLRTQGSMLLSDYALDALPLNASMVERILTVIDREIGQPAHNAYFVQDPSGQWLVVGEQSGLALDHDAARAALIATWERIAWDSQPTDVLASLPVTVLNPTITAADLQPALGMLQAQTREPLHMQAEGAEWQIDRALLLDLASLPTAGGAFRANRTAVRQWLVDTAATYNQTPEASLLVRDGNRATEWRLPRVGRSLDIDAAEQSIIAALETSSPATVALPVAITQPPAGDLEALGIVGVLGVGKSQFASYSSPNRDANVIAGGKEFDGLIIGPGETLSFNTTVGEITAEKGYAMGEMISGGQVVPSFGGGICQVSTTLFRAAFWGGLDIEERHFHAWRLEWYEADAPPGMDATIALGGPDLKIHNPTQGHILIDVETDLTAKTQTFTLYGSPQNIEVKLVGPTWNGSGVVIERQIFQRGAEIDRDSWASFYQ